jgi:chaperonin cofactor prefoldin
MNSLEMKIFPSLQAKVGRLEAKKNSHAKLKTKMREMREEFTMRLETMEQQQLKQMKQIAKLKVF